MYEHSTSYAIFPKKKKILAIWGNVSIAAFLFVCFSFVCFFCSFFTPFFQTNEQFCLGNVTTVHKKYSDEELSGNVDFILKQGDLDNDGFISYVEYIEYERKVGSGEY